MDMHSGGRTKIEPYDQIYIEAPEDMARVIFYNRFGRDPDNVTCRCCGPDYSISCEETLELATAYDRQCKWSKARNGYDETTGKMSVEQYASRKDVLVLREADLTEKDKDMMPLVKRGMGWQ
jgi:hypothetical protein